MGTKHVWRWASPSVSGCRSTNDTYMQLSGKRYVYTDITRKRCIHTDITPTACTHIYAQTIQTHRYHTNGTYTQSHNDAHNTTVRIHPDITQPVHRYHKTVRTQLKKRYWWLKLKTLLVPQTKNVTGASNEKRYYIYRHLSDLQCTTWNQSQTSRLLQPEGCDALYGISIYIYM